MKNLSTDNQADVIKAFNLTSRYLAHLSRRLIGELIVYQWSGVRRRRPSVRPSSSSSSVFVHNAQTSSSQKPLGRSNPNFMWNLLG